MKKAKGPSTALRIGAATIGFAFADLALFRGLPVDEVIGLSGGLAVGQAMGSLLNGVSPADPMTMAVVSALLAAVTIVATAIPALRASRTDPAIALRAE